MVLLLAMALNAHAASPHARLSPSTPPHAAPVRPVAVYLSVSVSSPPDVKSWNTTDWLLVIFNGFLAVFTFMLWRATVGMWDATKGMLQVAQKQGEDFRASIDVAATAAKAAERSAEIAERTLVLTQRPIMSLRQLMAAPIPPERSAQPVHSFHIWGIWENRGTAFARNVGLMIKLHSPLNEELPNIERQTESEGGIMLAPHGQLETTRPTIEIADLADIYLNQSRFLVVTGCFYGGLSGAGAQRYETIGCYEIEVTEDPANWRPGDRAPLHFRIFETGNSAT